MADKAGRTGGTKDARPGSGGRGAGDSAPSTDAEAGATDEATTSHAGTAAALATGAVPRAGMEARAGVGIRCKAGMTPGFVAGCATQCMCPDVEAGPSLSGCKAAAKRAARHSRKAHRAGSDRSRCLSTVRCFARFSTIITASSSRAWASSCGVALGKQGGKDGATSLPAPTVAAAPRERQRARL